MKRTIDKEFLTQLSTHIGRISSIHATPKNVGKLMRHFLRVSKYVPKEREDDYYLCLLETLIDLISGESHNSLFFFNGTEKAFIRLKSPFFCSDSGLYWTGWIRLEAGNSEKKQCIFSFLKQESNEIKGVELFIQEHKLFYHLLKLHSDPIKLQVIEIRENVWIHITMAHIGKELITYIDGSTSVEDIGNYTYPKEYNIATIGAAIDPSNNLPINHLIGEISALYFFKALPKLKETIKEVAHYGQHLYLAYRNQSALEENLLYFPEYTNCRGLKFMNREFVNCTLLAVDPTVNKIIFNKISRITHFLM